MLSAYCRASIYLHSPDTRPAACQMSLVYVSYVKMCVRELKPVHLFPLRSACLRHRDTSVAPGSADVGANAARLFTLNHVGTLQTPCCHCCCCCSYGLVSSSYWLLVKLKAGKRLIKDTWVCVARQGPGCGFYWLPGLINNSEPNGELVSSHIGLRCFHDVGVQVSVRMGGGECLCKCQCELS